MDSNDILWNPRMTHQLVRERVFADGEFVLVDVGMRGGIQSYWQMLGDQLSVIGFEPDPQECERLNHEPTVWKQSCYPVFLDRELRSRQFYIRGHNHAASGLHPPLINDVRYAVGMLPCIEDVVTPPPSTTVKTTTFDVFSRKNGLPAPNFIKIDVEGAELDVLNGSARTLSAAPVVGLEIECRFRRSLDAPLFADVLQFLDAYGFRPFNMSISRVSRGVLPLELNSDPRDHRGQPILWGPTKRGQLEFAEVAFFRDLIAEGFRADDRAATLQVLKAAVAFEIYNLPDCAAELLIHYRDSLSDIVSVEDYLEQLVPDVFGGPTSYEDYLRLYTQKLGRIKQPS